MRTGFCFATQSSQIDKKSKIRSKDISKWTKENKREEGNSNGRAINWNIFNVKIYRNIYVKIIKLHTKSVCVTA